MSPLIIEGTSVHYSIILLLAIIMGMSHFTRLIITHDVPIPLHNISYYTIKSTYKHPWMALTGSDLLYNVFARYTFKKQWVKFGPRTGIHNEAFCSNIIGLPYWLCTNLKSKLTSNVVDRVESYPILANIERVFSFDAIL